jgi:hypothetical protein
MMIDREEFGWQIGMWTKKNFVCLLLWTAVEDWFGTGSTERWNFCLSVQILMLFLPEHSQVGI